MAYIVCMVRGYPSIVGPGLELARRLAVDGHHVTFAGDPGDRQSAEHLGLAFHPLATNRHGDFLEADRNASPTMRWRGWRRRRHRATRALGVDELADDLRALKPDLLLIDAEMHAHILVAMATGVPIALLNSFASIWRSPGLPPTHCLVRPGVGVRGSPIGIALAWQALGLRKRVRRMRLFWRHAGCDSESVLRCLAGEQGIDARKELDTEHWSIPFTYRRLPVLSLHALAFEFPHRPPPHVRFVGPMVRESDPSNEASVPTADAACSPTEAPAALEAPEPVLDTVLDAVLARCASPSGEILIYAGFGASMTADPVLLRRLLGIVAARPTWRLVLSLGGGTKLDALGPLPARVHAFPWVPQRRVLATASACVTHGGINTIDECVLAGVPMLVYCGFETDMGGNTARVVHHGIGIAGDRRRDSVATIVGHLDRLLDDQSFGDPLERLACSYRADRDHRVAEHEVASLLAGRWP